MTNSAATLKDIKSERKSSTAGSDPSEINKLVEDIKDLFSRNALINSPEVAMLRERIESGVETLKKTSSEISREATQHVKQLAQSADHYVSNQPWRSAGIALLVGVAVGYVVGRKG